MKGSDYYANVYTTTFHRAMLSYEINGFFAKDLDADDHTFLEYVKTSGIANGQLPSTSAFLIEELDYWHMPYGIDWSVSRRHGPAEKQVISPDMSGIRSKIKRMERKRDNELMKVALARAQREWQEEQDRIAREREERLKKTIQADIEWEEAHPLVAKARDDNASYAPPNEPAILRYRPSGLPNRHYVPQWKRDEMTRRAERRAKRDAAKTLKQLEEIEAERERKALADRLIRMRERQEEEKQKELQQERICLAREQEEKERLAWRRKQAELLKEMERKRQAWLEQWNMQQYLPLVMPEDEPVEGA